MNAGRSRSIGRIAIGIGVICAINALTIILMYTVAPIFGPLNDVGVGMEGIAIALLAWMLHPFFGEQARRQRQLASIAATVGAGLVVVGSILVISGVTGWFLASLYTLFGYAVIGCWIVAANRFVQRSATWPPRLTRSGIATGVIMMFGLFVGPASGARVDNEAAAPWYANVGYAKGA